MTAAFDASPDAEILAAWRDWSEDKWQDQHGAPANLARCRECDKILVETIAHTSQGCAAKLRLALWVTASEPWLQALALGGAVPGLAEKMGMADMVEQIIWSAIESLERLGGVA